MIYNDLRKLIAVYEMIKEGETYTRLKDFMEAVTRDTTQIMGVKACSIKLLDEEGQKLRFASTYGLSEDYLSKDYISIEKSGVNRQVIDGSLYSIGHIDESKYFQYPEDVLKEGIVSMLCLPLTVDTKTFGVLCVYSDQPHYFKESDIGLFSLMTDLIALTMDRITRDAAKTWFMHKAAHQLRSPLNTIQSMLRLMDGGYLGPLNEKQKETVGRCQKRLSILQSTVNDLLKLAADRQEVGPVQLNPVDLPAVLKNLESIYRPRAEEKGLSFEFSLIDGLPVIPAQEKMLDELFSNLLSNAIKYTPAGGRISVNLSRISSEMLLCEIKDTGIGIPESDLPRLFSEFFRSENAKEMVEEGTGLGLVIVKEIADRLGWTVKFRSRVGQGTRVSCQIPVKT